MPRPIGELPRPDREVVAPLATSLFGREAEWRHVVGALAAVTAGDGRLILCTGDPGAGKTRLAEELATYARAVAVPVVWARATDRDGAPPFWLWQQVMRQLARRDDATADEGPGGWAAAVGSFAARAPLPTMAPDQERFALLVAVHDRLVEAAAERGLVVVLDDVHLADESSLRVLHHVTRQLRDMRLLIFATHRDRGPSTRPVDSLSALVGEPRSEVVRVEGLAPAAVEALLGSLGIDVTTDVVDRTMRATAGNPFLVRELGRAMLGDPAIAEGAGSASATDRSAAASIGPVPGTVIDATRHRIGALAPESARVLRPAAIIGAEFSVGVVAAILGQPVLSLLEPVDELVAAGFLVVGGRPGDYRFSHELVRAAVEAEVSTRERVTWHAAAADAIETLHAGRLRPHLTRLAHHRVRASLPGDRARAVAAVEAAADAAREDLAFEEAARLYGTACAVGAGEIDEEVAWRLRLGIAVAAYLAGDLPTWRERCLEVAHEAELRGHVPMIARVALIMEPVGEGVWDRGVLRTCDHALAGAACDATTRARLLARKAQTHVYLGDERAAQATSEQALTQAEAQGDVTALVDALRARQLACSGPTGLVPRGELARRMLELGQHQSDPRIEMWGRLWRIDVDFESGDLPGAARDIHALAACVDRVAGPLARWHLLTARATLAQATGRFDDALRWAAEAIGIMHDIGHPAGFGPYAAVVWAVGHHTGGERAGVHRLFADRPLSSPPPSADDGMTSVFPILSAVLVTADDGDVPAARALYGQAGPASTWRPNPALRIPLWTLGILAALAVDALDDVVVLADQLEPFRDRHAAGGAGQANYLGPVQLHLGRAAAALGRQDEAIIRLRAAVDECDRRGAPGFAVESRVALARVLVARGDLAAADEVLDDAAAGAGRLEMVPFVDRIAQLRASWSVGPVSVGPGSPDPSPLSPREREVATLVGEGLTNRQIAARLFVSERTAQNHVQHILTKLAFSNRSQIAAWQSNRARPGR